jgi:hypothetical protein
MRPHTVHQYALDAQLVEAMRRMETELEQIREMRLRDQKRLRQIERRITARD